ncbi:MAG: hypothetical protein IT348_00055 [Candidatus Eisenbacteria bacterium]|nr:hypothetical protein [Candidatus Eisenbacteria bacterium]
MIARGDTEYHLPLGINEFLDDAGIAADGEAAAEIAALAAQGARPGEALVIGAFAAISERATADGEHFTRLLRTTGQGGGAVEWRFSYGAGALSGLLSAVEMRDFGPDGAPRRHRLLMSPQRPHAGSISFGGDVYSELGYLFMLVDLDGASLGHQAVATLSGILDPGGAQPVDVFAQYTSFDDEYTTAFHGPVPVAIDASGNAVVSWSPPLGAPTGAAFLELGHMVSGAFVANAAWPRQAVFFEKARDLTYPGGTATQVRVHYCEAFFQHHPGSPGVPAGTAGTETFVADVLAGLAESWQSQVVDWSLAQGHPGNEPEDDDGLHHVYVNDHVTPYRKDVTGGAGSSARMGPNRMMWIRNDAYFIGIGGDTFAAQLYSNESIRTRIAVAHEFYHGIQAGWVNSLDVDGNALWIIEAQARAIPAIQYEAEEFLEKAQHLYPLDANRLLRLSYNSTFDAVPYRQCLYWRFLFDRNQPAGTTARRAAIFREVCQAMSGLLPAGGTDYLTPAVGAVDAGLASDGGVFASFMISRDSLAHTAWRHDYSHANPNVIDFPAVEDDADSNRVSAVWSGPPVVRDSILRNAWGVDFWNFQVDPTVALRRLKVSFDADADRDLAHSDFHLTILLYNALGMTHRIAVVPRGLAYWDSTFEVHSADSVTVIVHRVDMRADAHPYRLRLSHPLGVDAPAYDDIGAVLAGMGPRYRFDVVDEYDLADPLYPWHSYDALFLNCSIAASTQAPLVRDSLRAFVQRGGYLYVSDYDRDYIQQAWPGSIAFGPKEGVIQDVFAQITDPGLAAVMHTTSASVKYDLNQWATVAAPGPLTRVHMTGTYQVDHAGGVPQDGAALGHSHGSRQGVVAAGALPAGTQALEWRTGPLMLSFTDGLGRVIYTTFHNNAQLSAQQRALLKYMIYQQTAGPLLARTLEAITADWHEWLSAANGISPGESVTHEMNNPYNGMIEVLVNWGGSNLRLTARRPNGTVAGVAEGPSHPVRLTLPGAEAGLWHFDVEALDVPDSNYAYAIVVAGPDALPGVPRVEPIGETHGCPGAARLATIPVRNLALYGDDFAVHASSDLGWLVEPADTTIHAWEGMTDSLRVRVTPPAGVVLGTRDSIRVTLVSILNGANRDSGACAVRVSNSSPVLAAPADLNVLRGSDVPLPFTVTGVSGCDDLFTFTLTDSLGWPLYPLPGPVTIGTGASIVMPGVAVPAGAVVGVSNPLTLMATRVAGGMTPVSTTVRVFVQPPASVLIVDPSGGYHGSFITAALDSAGRTWTPWTGYGVPPPGVLEQYPAVLWLMGVAPFFPPDTAAIGAYLRGGGRAILSGQGMLASPFGAELATGYGGAAPASDGGGTLALEGRAGGFLGALGYCEIQGPGGAWNQYSPDELTPIGDAFAVLDYAPPPPATTGIAAVARAAGAWRVVTCGFGLEAVTPLAARTAMLEAMLNWLEFGSAGVPPARPLAWSISAMPNPSSGVTVLRLSVPRAASVRVGVHDLQGRRVFLLLDGALEPGSHSLVWDGRDRGGRRLPAGVYLVQVEGEPGLQLVRRVVRY